MLPGPKVGANICLDAAYDSMALRELLADRGLRYHIRSRREEADLKRRRRFRPRRWVVERAHSWLNRFRRILVRWEKLEANFLGMLHLACAVICFQQARLRASFSG